MISLKPSNEVDNFFMILVRLSMREGMVVREIMVGYMVLIFIFVRGKCFIFHWVFGPRLFFSSFVSVRVIIIDKPFGEGRDVFVVYVDVDEKSSVFIKVEAR